MKIAVVGGGIAGLAAAYRLSGAHEVVLFERESVAGGKIRSERIDRYLFEWGPSGFLSSASELRDLVHEIGLADALTPASEAAKKRYIYWDGVLHRLPAKPPDAFALKLLTAPGKLRALGELFVRAPRQIEDTESVQAFMQRRFGREVADRLVAPALLGVSGGDARTTSIAAIFPRLRELESEHGSVIRGMMRSKRAPGHLCSFADGGMQRLTARLAERLGDRLRLGSTVERIERAGTAWRIVHDGATTDADRAIVATPAHDAARLLEGVDGQLAAELRRIPYAPMRAVGVAYRAEDVPAPLDGFGFLAARNFGVRILGAFYTSSIVPAHAPDGTAYLRVFMGGATDPDAGSLSAGEALAVVRADLRTTLGITAAPIAHHEAVWPRAIPQYTLGHRAVLRGLDARLESLPGLALAGNAYRGIGLGDNVRDALAVAQRVGAP